MKPIKAIGLMSGTSLDGLDLASCEFFKLDNVWNYKIVAATTIKYPRQWISALKNAHNLSAYELALLNKDYGHYLGDLVKKFIIETAFKPDILASHGHTIFHKPEQGLTYQLGDGAALASVSGITTICDFRTGDVALGGQGAPLVPIGDKLLFAEYSACLNLGGISNISCDCDGKRIAYDISPCNMALNYLSGKLGKLYDEGGGIARSGKIIESLYNDLNQLDYYTLKAPKSLGREWYEEHFLPCINNKNFEIKDILATVTEHIAYQVCLSLKDFNTGNLLITGGGAHNKFLVERIKNRTPLSVVVPDTVVTDFKEALIFAFLGILRYTNQINVLSSVTGASKDHIAGAIYL